MENRACVIDSQRRTNTQISCFKAGRRQNEVSVVRSFISKQTIKCVPAHNESAMMKAVERRSKDQEAGQI